jgi:hypothetical protein
MRKRPPLRVALGDGTTGTVEDWRRKVRKSCQEPHDETQDLLDERNSLGRVTDKAWRKAVSIWARQKQFLGETIPLQFYLLMEKFGERRGHLSAHNETKASRASNAVKRHKAMAAEIVERSPWLKGEVSELARLIAPKTGAAERTIRRHLSK